ncbi:P-loop containing nucleoside triphosphate hydrolase protein [Multifurca ochricompacta]|uniref:RNA helicase n=1 Tax=Multifurca ochricompacta TaxID=376703 RepID=A0AAD4M2I4_9AGAM|nr:P-loop containing nucleoside triphosphate hydrolase protein [Multifurca ochricompacta]
MSLSRAIPSFPVVCRPAPGSSRTRLVKDLVPKSSTGLPRKSTRKLLEVAPRGASSGFTRDTPPHSLRRGKKLFRGAARPGGEREGRLRSLRGREEVKIGKRTAGKDDVRAHAQFDLSTPAEALHTLPPTFASPPLSDGLLQSVRNLLGPAARPTPIQSLSLKHLFVNSTSDEPRRFLLGSETGSGKSLAYLLPMLHDLKTNENLQSRRMGPRALVLAPTHELARQLASFGKALVHHARLRVQSASRANVASGVKARVSAAKMASAFTGNDAVGEFEVHHGSATGHPVDMLVGTPAKLLEMARGNGWNKEFTEGEEARRKKWVIGRPEVRLSDVEWVVVDEADVLFDPDFIDQTLLLLSDVAAARGKPVPIISRENKTQAPMLLDYPFHFVLTSATIPAALAAHLDAHHPSMTRLVSPQLHRLPAHLSLEFAPYSSGNRNAEVLAKLKTVWRDDALAGRPRAKVVIFTNTRARAGEFGAYLSEHKVANVVVTGGQDSKGKEGSGLRLYGSNRHLAGFLKPMSGKEGPSPSVLPLQGSGGGGRSADKVGNDGPHVLLSTSLLARGLDFDPSVTHIFVLEPPRNTADFLHRAGRTARAGGSGKVVVFGKAGGRGSGRLREMRQRLAALRARR